ncbi:MAG: tetratricopeptide repeat protein, partial [Phycisphaerales bacterium]|nr:tetratricopeptide repeat protein [Phycisphaerales bacterium]
MTPHMKCRVIATCLLVLSGPTWAKDQDRFPTLAVGEVIEGFITDADAAVHAPTLDGYGLTEPTVGKSFILRVTEQGIYHIDLHAPLFDSYLILRGANGEVITEDDDGLIATDSRVQITLDPNVTYTVDACALHGVRGDYSLTCTPGPAPELTPEQRRAADRADLEARAEAAEQAYGPEDPRTATSLNTLAVQLYRENEYNDAQALYERALAIREKALGPEHPETAQSLNNLAILLKDTGD